MEKQMDNHIEEIFGSVVGVITYSVCHIYNLKPICFVSTDYDFTSKSINVCLGVLTACISYFAVYFIKKYITHEEIKISKKK